jgi:Tannase-like family of unknown function (DUF6351)
MRSMRAGASPTACRHEAATLSGPGTCNTLYPKTVPPRVVAGAPITDDVLKCQLKPMDEADDAPVLFTGTEKLRLASIFPEGVCDYTRPAVGQSLVRASWQRC